VGGDGGALREKRAAPSPNRRRRGSTDSYQRNSPFLTGKLATSTIRVTDAVPAERMALWGRDVIGSRGSQAGSLEP